MMVGGVDLPGASVVEGKGLRSKGNVKKDKRNTIHDYSRKDVAKEKCKWCKCVIISMY